MTCSYDEVPAPTSAAHFHSSCYLFVGLTASLRECASICESRGAAPVCPSSDEENDDDDAFRVDERVIIRREARARDDS